MKYLAAYSLLVLGGNEKPTATDVEKMLRASGCSTDSYQIASLIEKVKEKPFHELVAAELGKQATIGTGSNPAAAETTKEGKKEEEGNVDRGSGWW